MAVTVGNWRFYTNASPDGSMVPLAAQNTVPTLTGPQTMGGNLRLRVQLVGDATGGTVSVTCYHSGNNSNFRAWSSSAEREWHRWWNGAGTSGATVGSLLLTGSTTAGKYHESSAVSETVGANQRVEIDISYQNNSWLPPGVPTYTQIRNGSTALVHEAGVPAIAQIGASPPDRLLTIGLAGTATDAGQVRDMDFGQWPRTFYSESGYYWFVAPRPSLDSAGSVSVFRWDGSGARGGVWSRTSVALNGTITTTSDGDVRQAPAFRQFGAASVFSIVSRPSSGNLRYIRGRETAGTITWGSNADLGTTSSDRVHCTIDGAGFHWIVSSAGSSLWAVCSTAADDGGTGYSPSFGTITARRFVLTETIASANPITAVPLGGNEIAIFYRTSSDIRMVRCTGSGMGTSMDCTDSSPVHFYDWGVARSGDWIYLNYRESTDDSDVTWQFRCYQISTNTWTTTTAGKPPKGSQISNNDGMPVVCDGNDVYVIGTSVGPNGGQDRPAMYMRYLGPGPNGSWDMTLSSAQAAGFRAQGGSGTVGLGVGKLLEGGRGNGDDIAAGSGGGGRIVIAYLYGDNDTVGHPFTYEYDYITLAASGGEAKSGTGGNLGTVNFTLGSGIGSRDSQPVGFVSVGAEAGGSTNAGGVLIPFPATTSVTNLLDVLVFGAASSSSGVTDPSGWSRVAYGTVTSQALIVWTRVASGAETGSVTIPGTSNTAWSGQITRFGGVHQTTPVDSGAAILQRESTSTLVPLPLVVSASGGAVPVVAASAPSASLTYVSAEANGRAMTEAFDWRQTTTDPAARSGSLYYSPIPLWQSGDAASVSLTTSVSRAAIGIAFLLRGVSGTLGPEHHYNNVPTNVGTVQLAAGSGLGERDIPPILQTVLDRWDGATLVRQRADRWDGAVLVQQTLEGA